MTVLTIQLTDQDYQRLEKTAREAGKSIEEMVQQLIAELPGDIAELDVIHDPLFLFEGYDSDGPEDLAANHDTYLYRREITQ
jgi:hypothetical protein